MSKDVSHPQDAYHHYGVPEPVAKAYLTYVRDHIRLVREAGERLGVPDEQLQVHDVSKLSQAEFRGYALHFMGPGAPDLFAEAFLHHVHFNAHHWQHWLFPDGFTPKGSTVEAGALPMPMNYILEMAADWQAMSMGQTRSWDMTDWLSNNLGKMRLHSLTRARLGTVLQGLGYRDVWEATGNG